MESKGTLAVIAVSALTSALVSFGIVAAINKDSGNGVHFTEDGHLYIPEPIKREGCASGLYRATKQSLSCVPILELSEDYIRKIEREAFDQASRYSLDPG